jgi:hypothetical protein
MKLNTKLHSAQPKFQPKLKNKRKSNDENANSEVEYGYDLQQDELEVKQQFSSYANQDVYFS